MKIIMALVLCLVVVGSADAFPRPHPVKWRYAFENWCVKHFEPVRMPKHPNFKGEPQR